MEVYRRSSWLLLLLGVSLLATALQGVQGEAEFEGPSECRPYIEKALKELGTGETIDLGASDLSDSKEDLPTIEITTDDNDHGDGEDDTREESEQKSAEDTESNDDQIIEQEDTQTHASQESKEESTQSEETHEAEENKTEEEGGESVETDDKKSEEVVDETESHEKVEDEQQLQQEQQEQDTESNEVGEKSGVEDKESQENQNESNEETKSEKEESQEQSAEQIITQESQEDTKEDDQNSKEDSVEEAPKSIEDKTESQEEETKESVETETAEEESVEQQPEIVEDDANSAADDGKSAEDEGKSTEDDGKSSEGSDVASETVDNNKDDSKESEDETHQDSTEQKEESVEENVEKTDVGEVSSEDSAPEEALGMDVEMPIELRPREHVEHLLKLDDESIEIENVINRISEITLRELKKIYENAIKPLETLYKYRDLSNRHFGDAEIFSKPLILFMGPWSGGKSSIINYLLNNEYNETSLRTGAEPSPAYFNILMYGDEPEVIDGTQLAADYTFSGLQKFGQGLEERLRGIKLPSKLLEKVNIVEIPGILEVRKQVSRVFPFNDACQWFIDRADIIFLVYDPSKLDVGPETEAILDQLKGREHQTRIILNKADQVKPEELMRVQGALIWNISPLMSSAQPPVMYTTSLWSRPYEPWAPVRLLQAQERAFLRDLRSAIDKRIENKIASARRFAVRVRNHAKMVDCYLTTYYNHKSVFGNRKQVADQIIEHPQDYHIYEGLSTLTNISRYDLPDPDVYRDFFKLNPLYDFQQLSATCTYFRGCPINRLDIAIAYDLPELVGKHKRLVESALAEINQTPES